MSAYTDQTKVSNYLKRDLTTKEQAIFSVLADAATDYIDQQLETNFQADPSATAREYDGCVGELIIDPCKDITTVKTLDSYGAVLTTLDTNSWKAYPLNKTIKRSIRFRFGREGGHVAGLQVTAKYTSYDDKVPQGIVLAATMLVAEYLQSDDYRVKAEETEGWKVQYDNLPELTGMIESLLAPYRRLVL